ncbi:MAG: hypothetical protein methR_P1814 [Methyloprofundus sp.]|nr:MAG: hypothetical protein methR_P1814 [Methyloprofundus sp.]
MEDTSLLIWGVLFGAIGLGYFTYGRKQRAVAPLFVGIALLVFPYFITNIYLLVATGVCLAVLPYFIKI